VDELPDHALDSAYSGGNPVWLGSDSPLPEYYELHRRLLPAIRRVSARRQLLVAIGVRGNLPALGALVFPLLDLTNG